MSAGFGVGGVCACARARKCILRHYVMTVHAKCLVFFCRIFDEVQDIFKMKMIDYFFFDFF